MAEATSIPRMPLLQRPRGRVHEILAAFRTRIERADLKPGERLPTESEITSEFGVSRTVVREALSRLQAQGLVETRHGVGTFVRTQRQGRALELDADGPDSLASLILLMELRICLEAEAAGLAAKRRSAEQLDALHDTLMEFQQAIRSGAENIPADFRFHLEVARAAGNPHFGSLLGYLGDHIIPRKHIDTARTALEGRTQYLQRVWGEHESIFIAIRNQDPEAARAAMRTHLANSCERLRRAQAGTRPGGPAP
jgi:GntR family transcriptional regulator, transcriptional repressor for pyruvate dehydrogenase complex